MLDILFPVRLIDEHVYSFRKNGKRYKHPYCQQAGLTGYC